MRGRKIWLSLFLGGALLAMAIPQWAQSPAARSSADEHARRSVAVNMLRAINEPQLGNVQFAKLPEILPGWALRLNVTADGKGYDVTLLWRIKPRSSVLAA